MLILFKVLTLKLKGLNPKPITILKINVKGPGSLTPKILKLHLKGLNQRSARF